MTGMVLLFLCFSEEYCFHFWSTFCLLNFYIPFVYCKLWRDLGWVAKRCSLVPLLLKAIESSMRTVLNLSSLAARQSGKKMVLCECGRWAHKRTQFHLHKRQACVPATHTNGASHISTAHGKWSCACLPITYAARLWMGCSPGVEDPLIYTNYSSRRNSRIAVRNLSKYNSHLYIYLFF